MTNERTVADPLPVAHIDHEAETDAEVDKHTGDDVHDEDRSAFPEDARFTDEEWAAVEAARARLEEDG